MTNAINLFDEAKTYHGIEVVHWWNNRVIHREAIDLKNLKEKEVSGKKLIMNPYLYFLNGINFSFSSQVIIGLPVKLKHSVLKKNKEKEDKSNLEYLFNNQNKKIHLGEGETLRVFDEDTESHFDLKLVESHDACKYNIDYFKESFGLFTGFILLAFIALKSMSFNKRINSDTIEERIISKITFHKPIKKSSLSTKITSNSLKESYTKKIVNKEKYQKKTNSKKTNNNISKTKNKNTLSTEKIKSLGILGMAMVKTDQSSGQLHEAANKMSGGSDKNKKSNTKLFATSSGKDEGSKNFDGIGNITPAGMAGMKQGNGQAKVPTLLSVPSNSIETSYKVSKSFIQRRIKANRRSIKYCYGKALTMNSKIYGKVLLSFNIATSGRVTEVNAIKNNLNSSSLVSCLKTKIKAISFKGLENPSIVEVRYPFVFSSQN